MIQILSAISMGANLAGGLPAGQDGAATSALFSKALAGLFAGTLASVPEGMSPLGSGATDEAAEQAKNAASGDDPANALLAMIGVPAQLLKEAVDTSIPVGKAGDPPGQDVAAVASKGGLAGKKLPVATEDLAGLVKADAAQSAADAQGMSSEGKIQISAALLAEATPRDFKALTALDPPVPSSAAATSAPAHAGQEALLAAGRAHAAANPAERMVMGMQQPLGAAGWHQELGDKVMLMVGRQVQSAELILNPPSLGAVEVRLNMSGTDASAQFFSANPVVRELIDSALPRLRDMMQGAGIALGEAMVSNQSFGQRNTPSETRTAMTRGDRQAEAETDVVSHTVTTVRGSRAMLLDYFA